MTIGALSEHTEVNIETIRYYERIGILPKTPTQRGRTQALRRRISVALGLRPTSTRIGFLP
jgi:MerR family mercuric resistance operon transcriptional regulator